MFEQHQFENNSSQNVSLKSSRYNESQSEIQVGQFQEQMVHSIPLSQSLNFCKYQDNRLHSILTQFAKSKSQLTEQEIQKKIWAEFCDEIFEYLFFESNLERLMTLIKQHNLYNQEKVLKLIRVKKNKQTDKLSFFIVKQIEEDDDDDDENLDSNSTQSTQISQKQKPMEGVLLSSKIEVVLLSEKSKKVFPLFMAINIMHQINKSEKINFLYFQWHFKGIEERNNEQFLFHIRIVKNNQENQNQSVETLNVDMNLMKRWYLDSLNPYSKYYQISRKLVPEMPQLTVKKIQQIILTPQEDQSQQIIDYCVNLLKYAIHIVADLSDPESLAFQYSLNSMRFLASFYVSEIANCGIIMLVSNLNQSFGKEKTDLIIEKLERDKNYMDSMERLFICKKRSYDKLYSYLYDQGKKGQNYRYCREDIPQIVGQILVRFEREIKNDNQYPHSYKKLDQVYICAQNYFDNLMRLIEWNLLNPQSYKKSYLKVKNHIKVTKSDRNLSLNLFQLLKNNVKPEKYYLIRKQIMDKMNSLGLGLPREDLIVFQHCKTISMIACLPYYSIFNMLCVKKMSFLDEVKEKKEELEFMISMNHLYQTKHHNKLKIDRIKTMYEEAKHKKECQDIFVRNYRQFLMLIKIFGIDASKESRGHEINEEEEKQSKTFFRQEVNNVLNVEFKNYIHYKGLNIFQSFFNQKEGDPFYQIIKQRLQSIFGRKQSQ